LIDLFIVFNATFSNISAISWRPVLVVEEAGVSGDNHQPWAIYKAGREPNNSLLGVVPVGMLQG
jgi:hypothetical protein